MKSLTRTRREWHVPFEQACGLNCIKDKGENINERWIASYKKNTFNSADLRCLFVCRGEESLQFRAKNRVSRLDLH